MGSKLEGVKGKSREGTESFREGSDRGRKNVADAKQMKAIYDAIPSDVDDEVLASTKMAAEAIKADAIADMNTNVKSKIEAGKGQMDSSSSDSNKQIANNENVKNAFSQMDSVGGFGKNARAEGRSKIDSVNKQFEAVVSDNISKTKEAENTFSEQLNEIDDTF